MKTSFVFIIMASLALFYLVSERSIRADETTTTQSAKHESPFACNAFVLSPEIRKRHFEEVGPALLKLKKSMRDTIMVARVNKDGSRCSHGPVGRLPDVKSTARRRPAIGRWVQHL